MHELSGVTFITSCHLMKLVALTEPLAGKGQCLPDSLIVLGIHSGDRKIGKPCARLY